jgi:hypothetical protein
MNRSFAAVVALVVACGVVAPTALTTDAGAEQHGIDSCTVINETGHYTLTADVESDEAEPCFDIRTDDVVLDGNGHTVTGPGPVEDDETIAAGVYVNASDEAENLTVRDVEFVG